MEYSNRLNSYKQIAIDPNTNFYTSSSLFTQIEKIFEIQTGKFKFLFLEILENQNSISLAIEKRLEKIEYSKDFGFELLKKKEQMLK